MDDLDRAIVNRLQLGFPLCERPYAEVAAELDTTEQDLLARLDALVEGGVLSRFGPLFNAERMGGGLCLCAMAVPDEELDAVARKVNALPEVAHNYARDHAMNLWFVLATEHAQRIDAACAEIEAATGHAVHPMPKLEEFHVRLFLEA